MNVDQSPSPSSLSRPASNLSNDQYVRRDERHFDRLNERHVPENYHHSSYEYLTSSHVSGDNHQMHQSYSSSANISSHQRSSSPHKTHQTTTAYSPATYQYQPASVLDEPSAVNPYVIQRPNPVPIPNKSLTAYVPQVSNGNRHSVLPATSDDSGNESSVNYHQQMTTANQTHFVVVAIDFGTTFSGYAFAFTRDVDSILMMRKVDGNDPGLFFIIELLM